MSLKVKDGGRLAGHFHIKASNNAFLFIITLLWLGKQVHLSTISLGSTLFYGLICLI